MAIRLTRTNSEYLAITSGLPSISGNFTICAWIYAQSLNASSWSVIFGFTINGIDCVFGFNAGSSPQTVALWNGTSDAYSSVMYATGVWRHVALVKNGGSVTAYVDGVSAVTQTGWPTTGATTYITLGSYNAGSGDFFDGRIYAVKSWTAVLNDAEVAAESVSILPSRFTDLWGWWPSLPDATRPNDYSGNGNNFTEYNTPTDEDPPPVGWGSYYSHFDVIAAGGTTYTQDVSGAVSAITGTTVKADQTTKAGAVATITGVLTRRDATAKSGALTPAGALTKRDASTKTGAVATISGALTRLNAAVKTGTVASISGALARRDATVKSGALTPSGTASKRTATSKAGSLDSSGALGAIRSVLVVVSGVVATISGALTRLNATTKSGALTPSGEISKKTATSKAGSLGSSGALGAIRTVLATVSGVVASISGALTRLNATAKSGTLTPAGETSKRTATSKAGSLDSSGALGALRMMMVAVAGVVGVAGSVSATLNHVMRKVWNGVAHLLRSLTGKGKMEQAWQGSAVLCREYAAVCVISRAYATKAEIVRDVTARANL